MMLAIPEKHMTKRTAKQRIERAVYRTETWHGQQSAESIEAWAVKLILAERARLKRGVRRGKKWLEGDDDPSEWMRGYLKACDDILTLWEW